jgi:cytochrome c biogenesis protein CcmG/thiol:disulfide interchange protein DsbE
MAWSVRSELGVALVLVVLAGSLVGAVDMRLDTVGVMEDELPEALDFTLVTVDGEALRLTDLRGRPVVIDLMATWCGACRLQMPALNRTYNMFGDAVVFLSVDLDWLETDDMLRDFRDQFGAEWRFGIDKGGSVFGAFFPDAFPTLVLLDREGRVVLTHVGVMEEADLQKEIQDLL